MNSSGKLILKAITGFIMSLFMITCAFASDKSPDVNQDTIDKAIGKVKPALVRIFVVTGDYYNGREMKHEVSGSGVIITKEGYVITNHHVVRNAKQITCTLSSKEEIDAELTGTDPLTDIAVIKLRPEKKREFPFASFGDSSLLKTGDPVLAMGSPFALSQSVTKGIVSNTEIIMPKFFWPMDKFTLEGEDVGSIVRWIGHDAPIYGGNSGGPLVNLNGEIVGINEISLGISGAIPGNLAKDIAEGIIKSGRISRSWIGLEVQPLFRDSKQEKGVVVSGTIEGSPAEKAGFLPGDILLNLAGKEISVKFPEEIPIFNQFVMELPVGKEVKATINRDGKNVTLSVITAEREYMRSNTVALKQWGITARNLSLLNAKEMKRDNKNGVYVTTVRTGGPCWDAKPKISSGDLIVEVDGKPIKNIADLMTVTKSITLDKNEPVPVIVAFERKKEQYITVVKVGIEQESKDKGMEVQKAWLPVAMQVLTKDIAKELGIPDIKGMRITQVYSGSSADKAGLRVGDIITAVDKEPVQTSSTEDYEILPTMIRQYKIGSTAELAIIRDKKELSIPVKLEKSPKPENEMKKYVDNDFDLTVRDIAFLDRAQEGWEESESGVLVEAVGEGGWASLARLAVGDLITGVNGEKVSNSASFEKIMKDISHKKPKNVLFQVTRGIHVFFAESEPAWENNISKNNR